MFKTRMTLIAGLALMLALHASMPRDSRRVLAHNLSSATTPATTLQTPTPTPTPNELLRRLQQEKDEATAEAAALEARLSLLKSQLGIAGLSPTATAPGGNIKAEGVSFIEVELLAEHAARQAARKLAKQICDDAKLGVKTLIIGESADYADVQNYRAVVAQAEAYRKQGEEKMAEADDSARKAEQALQKAQECLDSGGSNCPSPPQVAFAPLAAIPLATTSVRALADLVNLFRTDVTLQNQVVKPDAKMVATFLLAEQPQDCACHIYYPAVYRPTGLGGQSSSALVTEFQKLESVRLNAATREETFKTQAKDTGDKLTLIQREIIRLQAQTPGNPTINQQIENLRGHERNLNQLKPRLEEWLSYLAALKKGIVDFKNALPVTGPASQLTPTGAMYRAEVLARLLEKPETYVLDLTVIAAGTTRTRKNIFWNARLDHTGGVTLSARLFDLTGRMVRGYGVDHYYDYTKPKTIRSVLEFAPLGVPKAPQEQKTAKQPAKGKQNNAATGDGQP